MTPDEKSSRLMTHDAQLRELAGAVGSILSALQRLSSQNLTRTKMVARAFDADLERAEGHLCRRAAEAAYGQAAAVVAEVVSMSAEPENGG
jgi:hypothetical protein